MAEKTPLRARASCQPSSKTEAPKTAPRKARRMTAQATPRQAKRGAPAHSKFIFSIVLLHLLYLSRGNYVGGGGVDIPKISFMCCKRIRYLRLNMRTSGYMSV